MPSTQAPSTQQSTPSLPDWHRAAKIQKLFQDGYTDPEVSPHWIQGTRNRSCFWYRQPSTIRPGQNTFYIVDAASATLEPAFNHRRLANALLQHGIAIDIDITQTTGVQSLPLDWIDVILHGTELATNEKRTVRFRLDDKKFEFHNHDGSLRLYTGDMGEQHLQPLKKERASPVRDDGANEIIFVNRSKTKVCLFWIDAHGKPVYYWSVKAGESRVTKSFSGHVWRVVKADADEGGGAVVRADSSTDPKRIIASFVADSRGGKRLAIVDEGMMGLTEMMDELPSQVGESEEVNSTGTDEHYSRETGQSKAQHTKQTGFVKEYNVWARSEDGRETHLSKTGTDKTPFDERIYPSPNSRFIVVWQYSRQQKRELYHIESSPQGQLQPRLRTWQCRKAGDVIRVDRPRIFDLVKMQEVPTDGSERLFDNPYSITDMGWTTDGSEYRFLYNQRGHQLLRIVGMDVNGKTRSILEETSKTFIDYAYKQYYYIVETLDTTSSSGSELIWASERNGWNHLYLFDMATGKLKNQITKGEWVVHSVDRVDEEKRLIWLTAMGYPGRDPDPYYKHLVRIHFDGSESTFLTQGSGTHSWTWSPDYKRFIDTWSRVDLPPISVLRDAQTGTELLNLTTNTTPLQPLLATGWTTPEPFSAPGRDPQTLIFGLIIRPSSSVFSPLNKYPIIEHIYAGPHKFSVPKSFSLLTRYRRLAELGFIIVLIDGMGTNGRSKAFQDVCFKNSKDAGLLDRIAWIRAAARTRPWMDVERGVGIYGASAGGQNAVAALLWHGDFYKVAVAACGCHDDRVGGRLSWSEKYMGWPVDDGYAASSNVVHAERLRGRLMLIVGELDDNVDPASTMQFVNALIEAGKDYELLYMPGEGHGAASGDYAVRRRDDFFVRHLLGVEPPNRNDE